MWKDYLTLHLVSEAAPYLSKAFVDTRFEFYGKTLTGTPQHKDRWKRGVDQVDGALGEAVGKLYVAKYFTPADQGAGRRAREEPRSSRWASASTRSRG